MTPTRRTTISAALIVKNEEENLELCLNSLKSWVDEIVILDSGSTDNTLEIAKKFGAHTYVNTDWRGFGKQRQLAQTFVTCDYIIWLDADERVTSELATEVRRQLDDTSTNRIFSVNRLSWAFGRAIRHSGWFPDRVVRIYPANLTKYNDALVHEKVIIPAGVDVEALDGLIEHITYDSLTQYLRKSHSYALTWAEQKKKEGVRSSLSKALLHALGKFIKMYFLKAGFLDGKEGLLLAVLSTHYVFLKYAQLWLLNR